MTFECIWCGHTTEVDHAGWAYVYSIALLHFTSCATRPGATTSLEIQKVAARVADEMKEKERGS